MAAAVVLALATTTTRNQMKHSYRPDIDGLRAIAVLGVVAFHTGLPGIAGGFVGVDVFFVISGFLISSLLLQELHDTGRIDFLRFYARRARRLLPTFLLVVTATLAAGHWLLSPALGEVQSLSKAAIAATMMLANVFYLYCVTSSGVEGSWRFVWHSRGSATRSRRDRR